MWLIFALCFISDCHNNAILPAATAQRHTVFRTFSHAHRSERQAGWLCSVCHILRSTRRGCDHLDCVLLWCQRCSQEQWKHACLLSSRLSWHAIISVRVPAGKASSKTKTSVGRGYLLLPWAHYNTCRKSNFSSDQNLEKGCRFSSWLHH